VATEQRDTTTETPSGRDGRTRAQRRAARVAQREQERNAQVTTHKRQKWLPWAILGAIVVLAIGGWLFYMYMNYRGLDGLERVNPQSLSRDHMTGLLPQSYPQAPPWGGPHANTWQNCGVYAEPVPVDMAVHSLEHGAVWITYRPELPASDVQALRALARNQPYVLVSPWSADWPALPSPVVISAWGLQLKTDSASDSRLGDFVRRYANGPQTPEPGARCTGGAGTPLDNF
jgi:hypothetical protein